MIRPLVMMVTVLALLLASGCGTRPIAALDIRLLAPDIRPRDLAIASHLSLGEILVSADEIVSYQAETHCLRLSGDAWDRLQTLRVPVGGIPFAVCLDGQPAYAGALWTPLSSLSFDGAVIMLPSIEEGTICVEMGYPGPGFASGEDPRGDAQILQALRSAGKLRE